MRHQGDRLRRIASHLSSDDTMRRLVDPVIADLQFEHADATARGHRWRARLATLRAAGALARVGLHRIVPALHGALREDPAAWRVSRAALAAMALIIAALGALPLIALASGAYPSMPVTAANVSRLLLYVVPQAAPVAIPLGLAIGVLTACDRRFVPFRARGAVVLLVFAGTAVAFVMFMWIAPPATRAYRDLAEPGWIASRINVPGSLGDQFERAQRWAMVCATAVLAAFAFSAAAVARGRVEIRLAAGVATIAYLFLYLPIAVLAFRGALSVLMAAWLPNILFAAVTILLRGVRLTASR